MERHIQAQRVRNWPGNSGKLWLPRLIETMENVARPEIRAIPCDRRVLTAFGAHLARPASASVQGATRFSLRH
jgi:hypothetical protein